LILIIIGVINPIIGVIYPLDIGLLILYSINDSGVFGNNPQNLILILIDSNKTIGSDVNIDALP
jgi:hypothetical protein